ncbi:hypothetical protein AVEN_49287-1, partial [Araneus ventricosus]
SYVIAADITTDTTDGCTLYCQCDDQYSRTYTADDYTSCGENQVCMSGSCVSDQDGDGKISDF